MEENLNCYHQLLLLKILLTESLIVIMRIIC